MSFARALVFCFIALPAFAAPTQRVVPDAYPTIQAAIDAAAPGDTVHVEAGEYKEDLKFKNGITLEGEGHDKTILRDPTGGSPLLLVYNCPQGTVREIAFEAFPKTMTPVVTITNSGVTLEECEVRNAGAIGLAINGGKPTLRKSTFRNNGTGVYASMGCEPVLRDLLCTENTKVGITLGEKCRGSVQNCQVVKNGDHGIAVTNADADPEIASNTCSDNKGAGINVDKGASATLTSNLCERNVRSGIRVEDDAQKVVARKNVMRDNVRYGLRFGEGPEIVDEGNDYLHNNEVSKGELQQYLKRNDFAALETLAHRLRKDRARFIDGRWQLSAFYRYVAGVSMKSSVQEENVLLARLDRWQAAYPDSPVPLIVRGDACYEFAWRERGPGLGYEVTPEGLKGYLHYLGKATEALLQAEKMREGRRDPHLYTLLAQMHLVDEFEPAGALEPFDKCVALEPAYTPVYFIKVRSLLPRWGGRPGQMEVFADAAVERTRHIEGEAKYMQIALSAMDQDGQKSFFKEYKFDWPRICQGYYDLVKQFPNASATYVNTVAYLACHHNDRKTAAELFKVIGSSSESKIWKDRRHFVLWQRWANGERPAPPEPFLSLIHI